MKTLMKHLKKVQTAGYQLLSHHTPMHKFVCKHESWLQTAIVRNTMLPLFMYRVGRTIVIDCKGEVK